MPAITQHIRPPLQPQEVFVQHDQHPTDQAVAKLETVPGAQLHSLQMRIADQGIIFNFMN